MTNFPSTPKPHFETRRSATGRFVLHGVNRKKSIDEAVDVIKENKKLVDSYSKRNENLHR